MDEVKEIADVGKIATLTVEGAIADATATATGEIPPSKLSDILTNEANMVALKPLIANVVSKAASIKGLREEITKLFKEKNNTELNIALEALQKELIKMSNQAGTGGRKRRRTNKRKNYKKRRTTKRR